MSPDRHGWRIGLLVAAAAIYLTWQAARTDIMFADGLRYIRQAQAIGQGSWKQVLTRADDHPAYPLAIAAAHRVRGGDRPADWQAAAQIAAVMAGALLVIPLYLFTHELHGASAAWLCCVLAYLVPLTGHVLADALSEGTFLLCWMCASWCALRFLRKGSTGWLAAAIALAGLAYLTRPEGLLLPVALAGLQLASLLIPSLRLDGPAGRRAWAILVIGPLLCMGPYVALKGGLGTKPAVGRLLGLSPRSAAMAVERERPLDPDQTRVQAFVVASRNAALAVLGAVPPVLLPFVVLGALTAARDGSRRRAHLLVTAIMAAWLLALVRLHVTSGYCTPRHALIFALPCLALAARGLAHAADRVGARISDRLGLTRAGFARVGLLSFCLAAAGLAWAHELAVPINQGFRGYRLAGDWLAEHSPTDARVLDLKGWSLYYGQRTGYTFGEIEAAQHDRELGFVVAHDSLLVGPWAYCDVVRKAVGRRPPVRSFPEERQKGLAQVHVFDLRPAVARTDAAGDAR